MKFKSLRYNADIQQYCIRDFCVVFVQQNLSLYRQRFSVPGVVRSIRYVCLSLHTKTVERSDV